MEQERRRFGYRRVHVLLRREGHAVNHKRLVRLYREKRLMVRRRGGRKRAVGTRAPLIQPDGANVRWSLDFVHDQLGDGLRFRILAIVDDCTRECLALVADNSISGARVARELERVIARRRKPRMIVSDNRTELTSNVILRWDDDSRVAALHRAQQSDRSRPRRSRGLPRRLQPRATSVRLGWLAPAVYAAPLVPRWSSVLRNLASSAPKTLALVTQHGPGQPPDSTRRRMKLGGKVSDLGVHHVS